MANTTKLKPRRVNSFNEPSDGKNLGYKNDDQFKWQDGGGGGHQSFFKTQDEYDALPESKESDGNLYIIVDNHFVPIPFAELIQLTPIPDAILDELNTYPKDYAEYYYENNNITMEEYPSSVLPRADAYLKMYRFFIGNDLYQLVDTNLTEQELENGPASIRQFVTKILAGEWYYLAGSM